MKLSTYFGLTLLFVIGLPVMLEAQDDGGRYTENSQGFVRDDLLSADSGLNIRTTQYARMIVMFRGFGPVADEARTEIIEDSAILNQLITEAIPPRERRSLGVSVSNNNLASFIEGTGMLFFYDVDFVVTPSDDAKNQHQETVSPRNAWEQAKEAVRNSQGQVYRYQRVGLGQAGAARLDESVSYDEAKIERLKSHMTKVLGHAGNFRNLNSDDTITIYIYGPVVGDQRSVLAWRVTMSDAKTDGQVPTNKIEMKQYFQKTTSSVPGYTNYGSSGYLK